MDNSPHPRSPNAHERAAWHMASARLHLASAKGHRLANRPAWAHSSLAHAAFARRNARLELSTISFLQSKAA